MVKMLCFSLKAQVTSSYIQLEKESDGIDMFWRTDAQQAIHWQKYITDGFPISDTEVSERPFLDTCGALRINVYMWFVTSP